MRLLKTIRKIHRKMVIRGLSLCLVFAALISCGGSPAYADGAVIDREQGTLVINYLESFGEELPVEGASFRAYKVAEIAADGGFKSLVGAPVGSETTGEEALALAKKAGTESVPCVTDKNGMARLGLPIGVYVLEEEIPAKGHFSSAPCLFSLPFTRDNQWDYRVVVEPKANPAGDICVRKKVTGTGAETDREFHFRITLDADGEFDYTIDGTEQGKVKNGSVILLKAGQEAVISMIPAGTTYEVTETEAGKDGYTTTAAGEKGSVPPLSQAVVSFQNHKDAPTPTLTPTPVPTGTPTPPYNRPPQTGDTARTGFFVGLALISAAAIPIVLLLRKRLWK